MMMNLKKIKINHIWGALIEAPLFILYTLLINYFVMMIVVAIIGKQMAGKSAIDEYFYTLLIGAYLVYRAKRKITKFKI